MSVPTETKSSNAQRDGCDCPGVMEQSGRMISVVALPVHESEESCGVEPTRVLLLADVVEPRAFDFCDPARSGASQAAEESSVAGSSRAPLSASLPSRSASSGLLCLPGLRGSSSPSGCKATGGVAERPNATLQSMAVGLIPLPLRLAVDRAASPASCRIRSACGHVCLCSACHSDTKQASEQKVAPQRQDRGLAQTFLHCGRVHITRCRCQLVR